MSTKTITVTEEAYEALKSMKAARESFSKTILRIAKRKSLSYFYGALGSKSGEKLEEAVLKNRLGSKRSDRIRRIAKELKK